LLILYEGDAGPNRPKGMLEIMHTAGDLH